MEAYFVKPKATCDEEDMSHGENRSADEEEATVNTYLPCNEKVDYSLGRHLLYGQKPSPISFTSPSGLSPSSSLLYGQKRLADEEENENESKNKKQKITGSEPNIPKNALIRLHEMSAQMKKNLQWSLLGMEGMVHEPTFYMQVEFDGKLFTGQGTSKKIAKHNCAENVLKSLEYSLNGQKEVQDIVPPGTEHVLTPQQPKIERQYAQNPVMEVHELFRDLKFEFTEVQHFPHYIVQCSVEIESETFKGKDSSKKEAKFLAASAAIQRLKETGRYDELRAQIAEKREERRKQRELKQKEIWDKRDKTTEECENKYHIMNYFYKRHEEAMFNLRSYKNNEEKDKWEMSVIVDDILFIGTGQSDQAAKRAAALSVLRYEVEIGAITDDITRLLNQDPNNPIKVPVERVAEVKQEYVNQEPQPPGVAEVKQDEVNQEPQPPGVDF